MEWTNDYYKDITIKELQEDLEKLNKITAKYQENMNIAEQVHLMLANAELMEIEDNKLTDEYSFHMGRFVSARYLKAYIGTVKFTIQEYFQTYGDNFCIFDESKEKED